MHRSDACIRCAGSLLVRIELPTISIRFLLEVAYDGACYVSECLPCNLIEVLYYLFYSQFEAAECTRDILKPDFCTLRGMAFDFWRQRISFLA
jgi:hypothetical protein